MEPRFAEIDKKQIGFIEKDQGICVRSGKNYALLTPDEVADNPQKNIAILVNKANIEKDPTDIKFFKFKSVEINDGN